MRVTSSRAYSRPPPVPRMPQGLVELMEGLTKEVLKNKPANVLEFCAEHMEKLLEIREGPSKKKHVTLEEKIMNAQEVLNQRANLRRKRYDEQVLANKVQIECIIEPESTSSSYLNTPTQVKLITNNGELEISQEPSKDITDSDDKNENSNKENLLNEETILIDTIEKIQNYDSTVPANKNQDDKIQDTYEAIQNVNENIYKNTNEVDDGPIPNKMYLKEISKQEVTQLASSEESDIKNQSMIDVDDKTSVICEIVGEKVEDDTEKQDENTDDSSTSLFRLEKGVMLQNDEIINRVKAAEEYGNYELVSTSLKNDIANAACTELKGDVSENTINSDKKKLAVSDEAHNIKLSNEFDGDQMVHISKNTLSGEAMMMISDNTYSTNELVSDLETSLTVHLKTDLQNNTQSTKDDINKELSKDDNKKTEAEKEIIEKIEDKKEENQQESWNNNVRIVTDKEILDEKSNSSNFDRGPDTENLGSFSIERSNSLSEMTNENTELDSNQSDKDLAFTDNPKDVNLEAAAVTIQKVFRSFLFKNRTSTFDDTTNDDNDNMLEEENEKEDAEVKYSSLSNLNKDRRSLGLCRMDTVTVLQTVNEEKSLSLSTDDSSTLSSAATTIQAHVRGFLVRNRLNSNKTNSNNSLVNSDGLSNASLEMDADNQANKTILNIHIVPEGGHFMSRDESLLTSMDLSLDGSPPSSSNLHPLGYDRSERRKQLKREDAIQSISPPSNNSAKLSEDVDSVKEMTTESVEASHEIIDDVATQINVNGEINVVSETTPTRSTTVENVIEFEKNDGESSLVLDQGVENMHVNERKLSKINSDEMDVVTPFVLEPNKLQEHLKPCKLLHSGECHDMVLPTKVSRADKAVVSEFKNVLVYFLRWNG